ncbi:MAG: hypothetical protein ACPG5O_04065 [Pseudoalteromonas tetraodonis]
MKNQEVEWGEIILQEHCYKMELLAKLAYEYNCTEIRQIVKLHTPRPVADETHTTYGRFKNRTAQVVVDKYTQFENWFNANCGWFFINGNKAQHERSQ